MNYLHLYGFFFIFIYTVVEGSKLAGGYHALFLYYAYKLDFQTNLKYAADGKTIINGHSIIARDLKNKVGVNIQPNECATFAEFIEFITPTTAKNKDKTRHVPLKDADTKTPQISLGGDDRLSALQHDNNKLFPHIIASGQKGVQLDDIYKLTREVLDSARSRTYIDKAAVKTYNEMITLSLEWAASGRKVDFEEWKHNSFAADFGLTAKTKEATTGKGVKYKMFDLVDTLNNAPASLHDNIKVWDELFGSKEHDETHDLYKGLPLKSSGLGPDDMLAEEKANAKRRKAAATHKSKLELTDSLVDWVRSPVGCPSK